MTAFLASVDGAAEARTVLAGGADIVDLKDPARGALGAVVPEALAAAVAAVGGRCTVSATVGDPGGEVDEVLARVRRTAAAGVDIVKVGLAGDPRAGAALLAALGAEACRGVAVVGVVLADRGPVQPWIEPCAAAGLFGVMLDTADKGAGSLRERFSPAMLASFVKTARAAGLRAGLAGSLRCEDVQPLLALQPDYLGFRGALCAAGTRTARIDAAAVRAIRERIPRRELGVDQWFHAAAPAAGEWHARAWRPPGCGAGSQEGRSDELERA